MPTDVPTANNATAGSELLPPLSSHESSSPNTDVVMKSQNIVLDGDPMEEEMAMDM
jgi:hypothetical protein